jgi:hypothetical protein
MADIIMRNVVEPSVFIDKVSEKMKLLENVNKNFTLELEETLLELSSAQTIIRLLKE